jgi:hypothetical protein
MTSQQDPANVKTLPAGGGQETQRFFGAWLDINQLTEQLPPGPEPIPTGLGRRAGSPSRT